MALKIDAPIKRIRAAAAACAVLLLLACSQSFSPEKLMSSAKEFLAKGDRQAAMIELKNLLQAAPDNGEARFLLGKASLETRDFATAEKELRRALDLQQPPDAVLPLLARAMSELGQHEALLRDFGDRKLDDPQAQASFQVLLAEAHLRKNDRSAAAAAYAAALAAVPGYAPARLGEVTLIALDRKFDEALAGVDAIIEASPKLAGAHALRSDLLLIRNDRAGARKSLEAAIEADGNLLPPRFALIGLLIDEREFDAAAALIEGTRRVAASDLRLTYAEALLAYRKGERDKARQHIEQVLKSLPEHVPSLVLAGALDLQERKYVAAELNLGKAVARAPNHIGARQLLVQTYLRLGQPTKARDALQPLIEKGAPQNPQLLLLAGETFLANGDVKSAGAFYEAASKSGQAQGAAAKTRLGQIALASGKPEEGFKELEAAAELDAGQYQADLAIIAGHLRRNEPDKAMAAVRALEKKQPNNPLTFQMYGVTSLAKGDVPAARRNFDKALELQPSYLPAAYNLAMLDLRDKRPEEARKRYEAMIAKDARNDQLHLALADLLVRTNAAPDEVARELQRAVEANAQSVPARLALINFHLRNKDTKAALAAAQSALAAMPSEPRILEASGVALEAAGEVNRAIETFVKLTSLQPNAPQPLLRLAGLYARQKDTSRAVDALRRAQKLVPNQRDLVPQLVQVYIAGNQPDEALREARALQKNDPKFAGGYALEGDVLASQRQFAQAEKPYREALKLEPKADAVAIRLHRVLAQGGRQAEADAFAKTWMGQNPKNIAMRIYLGEQDLAAKNYKAAAAHYQAVLATEPNNAIALNNLAWIGGETGDSKALEYAERAVKLAPNSAAIVDTYGMLLIKSGNTAKGLETLARATALAPTRYDLRLNYAKALAGAGQKDAARKELESLQAIPEDFPGKSEIATLLKAL
jgi:putative PEP-CTERM system TPR-repeat lipoprotein